jgi:hypothetical protein
MMNPNVDELLDEGGHYRIYVKPPNGTTVDVTKFRGIPTLISSISYADPFADATAELSFPQITSYDRPGTGDLSWLVPWADVDIVYFDIDGVATDYCWEGFIVSEEISDTYSIQCKGALYQLDNFLAAPYFPQYPVPYEILIREAFNPTKRLSLRTSALTTTFPSDWTLVVPVYNEPSYLWFLRPWGVTPGQKWTGLTSRSTGTWEPYLTGFVQSLISVMFTENGGQWTVMKDRGRRPTLKVRTPIRAVSDSTLTVYNGAPGVKLSISRDFTQSANVIYASGKDLSGKEYSGQEVTADAQTTYYEPFGALPTVYPAMATNPRLLRYVTRKESRIQYPQGMDEGSARDATLTQLRKYADPGFTGTLNLESDPMMGNVPFSRMLIRAGQSILVKNVRESDLLFHISQVQISPQEGTANLTIDTKFRDQLSVAEVRARTRDALDPVNLLQAGKLSVTTQDLIKPWSNTGGSGIIPSGGHSDATEFFTKKMSQSSKFPWTDFTTRYPPKNKAYAKYYIKLNPKNAVATKNWSAETRDNSGVGIAAIPVKMSQSGTIRLTQIAAYDANGNVKPVRFHVGLYGNSGVSAKDMPMIPSPVPAGVPYPASQRYPFFPGAFDQIKPDGTQQDNVGVLLPSGADMVIGWGTYYEGAGYWPGMQSAKNSKTGLLVDESPWSFDTSNVPGFDKFSTKNTQKNPTAGMMYILIYCDDQGTSPIYFLGRMYVASPGA